LVLELLSRGQGAPEGEADAAGRAVERVRPASALGRPELGSAVQLPARPATLDQEPAQMGPVTTAVFDDTCGNLIQITSPAPG